MSACNVDNFLPAAMLMATMRHATFGLLFSWNVLTRLVTGDTLMSDSLHLNEDGGNIIKHLVVDWSLSC